MSIKIITKKEIGSIIEKKAGINAKDTDQLKRLLER